MKRFRAMRDPRHQLHWWRVFDTEEMVWMSSCVDISRWKVATAARGMNRVDRKHPGRRADSYLRTQSQASG